MYITLEQWTAFFKSNKKPSIRENIIKDWVIALKDGIDPNHQKRPEKSKSLGNKSEDIQTFIDEISKTITPHLGVRTSLNNGWIACDADGVILNIYSIHTEFINFFNSLGITKGVNFSGKCFGTHAISIALKIKKINICHRYEHYSSCFHDYFSIASPVFNINGKIVGYLAVFCDYRVGIPENLLMTLRLIIQALDNKMRLERLATRYHELQNLQDGLIKNNEKSIIIASTQGYLRQINPVGINLLNLYNGIKETSLDKIAHFKPQIKSFTSVGMIQENIAMEINLDNKKLKVIASSYPCYSKEDKLIGAVIIISEKSSKKKINKEHNYKTIYTFNDIIGASPILNNAKALAKQIAKAPISVLLTGESGTGKEMFAQSIHNESEFKDGAFVSLNCSAIPRDLAESELFGHMKGAFTGALSNGRMGKLEAANKGTIFFDEIEEMPLELQAKLLRVLDMKSFSRIGENKQRNINFRVIAATNKDLRQLVKDKSFREDLYYRIAVSNIHLPALHESKEDIPAIFMNFVEYYNEQMGKKVTKVQEDLWKLLINYPWKGNIRELRNTAEYCVMMNSGEDSIAINHLPGDMRIPLLYPNNVLASTDPLYREKETLNNNENILLKKALKISNNNMTKAAKIMGISRATLYRKIKKNKINIQVSQPK